MTRASSVAVITQLLALALAAGTTTREAELLDAWLRSEGRGIDVVAACNPRHQDVTVDEVPGEVQVLVSVTDPEEHEDLATGVTIDLDDPLGDRALVDASTPRRVDVSR